MRTGHQNRVRVLVGVAAVVFLAFGASSAIQPEGEGRPGRGPVMNADELSSRIDQRIAAMEQTLERMRVVRRDLETERDTDAAVRELANIYRELIESGPLGDALRRRGGENRFDDRGPRPQRGDAPPQAEVSGDEIRAYIEANLPGVAERVQAAERIHPGLGERVLARLRGRVVELIRVEREDPDMAGLQLDEMKAAMDVVDAARAFRMSGDSADDRTAARVRLRAALGAQFDAHIALRRHEVIATARRVAELEADIERRESGRDAFLDEKLEELTTRPPRWLIERDGPDNRRGAKRPEERP